MKQREIEKLECVNCGGDYIEGDLIPINPTAYECAGCIYAC